MTLAWMLLALLFTGCLALATAAAEPLVRALGWPTRWLWVVALAVGVLWPPLAPIAAHAVPGIHSVTTLLPLSVMLKGTVRADVAGGTSGDVVSRVAIGLWMVASLILAIRLLRAALALHAMRRRAERHFVDGVPVLLTDHIGPATVGLRHQVVLVPRDLLDLEEPLRRLVLHHEREHCVAHDPWLPLAAAIAVVLLPWNAALWYVARRLRLAVEIDCDARVLASGADETRYARLLLWVAHARVALPFATALASPPSHLERRITVMRTRFVRPRPLHLFGAGALAVLAIAGACSAGAPDAPTARAAQQPNARAPRRVATALTPKDSFFEFQLDKTAQQIPGTGRLTYPAAMRQAHREGEVLAQFVVDTRGEADMSTFKALKSTDPAFTNAVREAVPTMRFTPALVDGRPVLQLVQQPFVFSLSGVSKSAQ